METAQMPITQGSMQPSKVPRESPEDASTSNTALEVVGGSWRVTWLNQDSEPLPGYQLALVLAVGNC